MTLSAVITHKHIADTVCSGEAGCFMHGPTFMGNPLACAVANANLAILEKNQWQRQVENIEKQFAYELPIIATLEKVKQVRWLGAIGVVELHQAVNMMEIQQAFVNAGVWIRPFGRLIYIMPPYIITSAQLSCLTQAIYQALNT